MSGQEIVEKKCEGCDKTIYVQKEYVRDKMFCTLGCMGDPKVKKSIWKGIIRKDIYVRRK